MGCEVPRIFTPPLRKLTPKTTLGYAFIEFARDVVGFELDPWQQWLAIHALELREDGTFRFRTILTLVARQNGKSLFLQILALFFMFVRGVGLVIGTAQNLDIAEEVWQGVVDIAEGVPDLNVEVDNVSRVNGKKALELRQGERYKVQAANRRGGRGLTGDLVMLDELREHQNWDAWAAVTKTTMARPFAQIWAASNAGDASSVVLAHLRLLAHIALGDPDGLADVSASVLPTYLDDIEDDSLGIFEWSAAPECAMTDRDAWAQANPSLGYRITERAIASALATDVEAVFRTEVLCQWVDDLAPKKISPIAWNLCIDPDSRMRKPITLTFSVNPESTWAAIGAAGDRPNGGVHVECLDHDEGTAWVAERLHDLKRGYKPWGIICNPVGPALALVPEIEDLLGIEVQKVTAREYAQACGMVLNGVTDHTLWHLGEPSELNIAVAGAGFRPLGDAWAWSWAASSADITPLEVVTLAVWGNAQKPPPKKARVVDLAAALAEAAEEEAKAAEAARGN